MLAYERFSRRANEIEFGDPFNFIPFHSLRCHLVVVVVAIIVIVIVIVITIVVRHARLS